MCYDVIVVGAGPAGATVARLTGQRGLKTLLLEKERFPRHKPCGGGLTPGVGRLLNMDYSNVIEQVVTRVAFHFGDEERQVLHAPNVRLEMVSRERFDQHLVAEAVRHGVQFMENVRVNNLEVQDDWVNVRADRGATWRSRIVVGADGANSRVARLAGLDVGVGGVAIEAEVYPKNEAVCEDFADQAIVGFDAHLHGYGWIFPKRDHLSVGVGSFVSRNTSIRLGDAFERFLRRFACLDGARVIRRRGWPIPIHREVHVVNSERVCLVGDAAALADPLTGEGIYYAIHSGILAADAICQDLPIKGALTRFYSQQVEKRIMADLLRAARIATVFYRTPHAFLSLSPFVKALAHIAAKEATYEALMTGVARKALLDALFRLPHAQVEAARDARL